MDPSFEILRVEKITVVKHRTGRRLTLRYEIEGRGTNRDVRRIELYAKLYRGRRGERIHRFLSWWEAERRTSPRLPRSLGYSSKRRVLLLEALPGIPLSHQLRREPCTAMLERLGSDLARFHAPPSDREPAIAELPDHDATAEENVLRRARGVVDISGLPSALIEAHAELESEIIRRLHAGPIGRASRHDAILHRDLYPEQVLVHQGAHALVDLDDVSLGEPELDAGNFAAHLVLEDLQTRGRSGPARSRTQHLVTGYAVRRELDPRRLDVYTASTLVRLASLERVAGPERSVLDWPALAGALLGEARRILTGTT
jgi:hypothetical protein